MIDAFTTGWILGIITGISFIALILIYGQFIRGILRK
jgi:hypothetical protein